MKVSDRTNRDIGNKKAKKAHERLCDCWHCTDGATKKRIKLDRELKRQLGYSRIGLNNV